MSTPPPRRPIVIAPYDSTWPMVFAAEAIVLKAAFGDVLAVTEHIGSTAVPGLGAKPVIDIMAGVQSLSEVGRCIPLLEALDYLYMPQYEVDLPDRRFLAKPREGVRRFNLHVVEENSSFWRRHLLFRDVLRSEAPMRQEYEALKRRLAEEYGDDLGSYTDSKTAFIAAAVERAANPRIGR